MLPPRAHSCLLLLAVTIGGGCSPSVEPIAVGQDCPDKPFRGPEEYANEPGDQLVTDFETGTNLARVAGRDGSWVLGKDGTATTITAQASTDCAARDRSAGHFAATGVKSWGNNWIAMFRASVGVVPQPYDARAYGGISFWAAFGGKNGPSFAVPVGIATMDTANFSPACLVAGRDGCNDHYRTTTPPFTHDWRRYVVRFEDMVQEGWGIPQAAMRRDQMVGFVIWPTQPVQKFDIWIDDIRFEP
jgi:hypothetical protein